MTDQSRQLAGWVRKAGGIGWFIRRFGFAQLFMKPIRTGMAPLVLPLLKERTVVFRGESIPLVYARHNVTWANERCVELALARRFLAGIPAERILEVGNVTPHYFGGGPTVVDKYEPGALQVDIVDFESDRRFDLILSISTFEHIAFDEAGGPQEPEAVAAKIRAALDRCKGLLAPGGKFVITVPMGYNPALDAMIAAGGLGCDRATWFKRFPGRQWREVGRGEGMGCRYGSPYPFANAIVLAEWDG
ncbi:MAG: hypothetical protein OXF01_12210 [Gemmatimonadetes bacterium]|nr:hypothetical protein [Gemmatimonadota bacterium]